MAARREPVEVESGTVRFHHKNGGSRLGLPDSLGSSRKCCLAMEWIQQNWLIIVLGIVVMLVFLGMRALGQNRRLPYEHRGKLMTQSERKFYRVLQEVVEDRWTVFAMVRIADLIKVRSGTPKHLSWHNRISCKHIDFVLCDKDQLSPLVGIELDDASHQRADRQERDRFVNQAFKDAAFPLLRIPTADGYDVAELRTQLERVVAKL
jgi:hypothetical protein